ncbi:MAG: 3-methyl-2-oxobutanoate dehydrogenase (2-methylpropanoyl-transferring) subunit alpha [Euryarchaeota archaeon]|nr:3-methyl-2-oxobutanoate dehydrogenase (2-methylpropanoyl-transferring) subunit alpha [Euryarchaeota archaeon]
MPERLTATEAPYTIGTPPFRPGEEADFGEGFVEQPGDLNKPEVNCSAQDTATHAVGLIRVLDDEHVAHGEWNPNLDEETLLKGLEHMMRLRIFDDRMIKMQRTGLLSFYMRSFGEEAIAIAQTMALEEQDWLFPSYRQPGAQFVRGRDMVSMICHCIGNTEDNVRGRQMPVHYTWKEGRFISISSPVGTQFPQAVGVAMASAYRGLDEVCISWLGDGTSAQGDFHYAVNFASTFKPPVILNVVNNQWAISTHANLATGGRTFAERGLAYDIPSFRVDGNDFLALYAVTKWARDRAGAGLGPTFIEVYTYRAGAHSSSDDPIAYRPQDEFKHWPGGDPIERLKGHLIGRGLWDEDKHTELTERIDAEVMAAYKEACTFGDLANGPYPPASTIFTEVYEEVPWHVQEQREELGK